MLSDVEKGNNLMLTRLTTVATLVRTTNACHPGHSLSSSLQNFKDTVCSFHFLIFLAASLLSE